MPTLTAVCSTAASHGRQRLGQVSESSAAPTAHSPPMPSAARKRKINRCHQAWAKYDSPVNTRVGENRQHQRAAAAHAVADPPEETAAQSPADQERGLDERAVAGHRRIARLDGQQLRPRMAWPRACTGACRARRTASRARPRCPSAIARAKDRPAAPPRAIPDRCQAALRSATKRAIPWSWLARGLHSCGQGTRGNRQNNRPARTVPAARRRGRPEPLARRPPPDGARR